MDSRKSHPWIGVNVPATALVKTGPGSLHTIVINTAVATATVTVYDGVDAGGTVLGTITIPAAAIAPITLTYDIEFSTGLYIAIAVAAADLTVSYV